MCAFRGTIFEVRKSSAAARFEAAGYDRRPCRCSARPHALPCPSCPIASPRRRRDYWVFDDVLPDRRRACAHARSRAPTGCEGFPHKPESWPGMRVTAGACSPTNSRSSKRWCAMATGVDETLRWRPRRIGAHRRRTTASRWSAPTNAMHGRHTDSRRVAGRFAAVLLSQSRRRPTACGTTFFRQRLPGAASAAGTCADARRIQTAGARQLGTRFVPPDVIRRRRRRRPSASIDCCCIARTCCTARLAYHGRTLEEKRMAAVFFWMAKCRYFSLISRRRSSR